MATYTTNYNLIKPADADGYDIAHQNGNMDIIDSGLNALNSKLANLRTIYHNTEWAASHTVNFPNTPCFFIMVSTGDLWSGTVYNDGTGVAGKVGGAENNIQSASISGYVMTVTMSAQRGLAVLAI